MLPLRSGALAEFVQDLPHFRQVASNQLARRGELASAAPQIWLGAKAGEGFLVYPGSQDLLSTVRLERLREGLDDYDYLVALQDAFEQGEVTGASLTGWLAKPWYPPAPTTENLDWLAEQLPQRHLAIGETLHALALSAAEFLEPIEPVE